MKRVNFLAFILVTLCGMANASAATSGIASISGNFEGTGSSKITYSTDGDQTSIDFHPSNGTGAKHYTFTKIDECSTMQVYKVRDGEVDDLAVDGSCSSQGGQIYIYVYSWDASNKNFCLRRVVSGEKSDITDNKLFPTEKVNRVSGCIEIGKTDGLIYESDGKTQNLISTRLAAVNKFKSAPPLAKDFISDLSDVDVAEISSNIGPGNVQTANDLAFYMINLGKDYWAGQILTSIVNTFPDRVVAKLNLADAYWNIQGGKDSAKIWYSKYSDQMKNSDKASKIPSRVTERIAQ